MKRMFIPPVSPNPAVQPKPRMDAWPSMLNPHPPIPPGGGAAVGAGPTGMVGLGDAGAYIRDLWHVQNWLTVEGLVLDVTTTSPFLLRADGLRNGLLLTNVSPGTEVVYVGFDQIPTVQSPIRIPVGGILYFDVGVPQNDLYAIGSAVTAVLSYAYSNIQGW